MYEAKVKELGLEIPEVNPPLAKYIPALVDGKYVYTAGQLPMKDGKMIAEGKVGKDVTEEDAAKAAQLCALNCLAVIKKEAGSLDNIERIMKLTVFVNSADGFTAQPKVANGASELMAEIFGDNGKHVRSAVGVNELPINAPVEIEMIAKLK